MNEAAMDRTVGELVVERPSRSRVLSKLGIDFCCGGNKSLEKACNEKGLDVTQVVALLKAHDAPEEQPHELSSAPLAVICDHLESKHHAYLKEELPRVGAMLDKVAKVHGERHPYMIGVARDFNAFAEDMLLHMQKEERVLFPAIRRLEGGATLDVAAPVRMMVLEHDAHGEMIRKLREATKDFAPPAGACNTFRAALDGLAEMERDTHEHIHKENNILFPRSLDLIG